MKKRLLILVCIPFLWKGQAQGLDVKKEPRVGVVLSGGGAKGLAHIGALKVIEEAGIKIDFIGGTSMGAIVGGLYASGYTANQLDSIFKGTDFNELIQDELPRSTKSFYEKKVSEKYALSLPFNNFKISFPQAYSGGQNVYNELVRLLYQVGHITDFKELPIPFLCVATDVETGQEVVLDQGYLPQAIMASGTLPSLFEPTIIDGRVLIDGGVVNNYPVEEVINMGADVIIGVDVQYGLRDRNNLSSATEILMQINSYRTAGDMKAKEQLTNVYIKPDLSEYSLVDFESTVEIIKLGEDQARTHFEGLRRIAEQQPQRPGLPLMVRENDSLTINELVINGNENYSRGYVKGKLRFDLREKIDFTRLQQGIGNLLATDNFKTIRYELVPRGDGVGLILNLHENPTKDFLRLAAHYDDLYKTSALVNLTNKNLLAKDDVSSFDFIFGDNLRYNYQYLIDKGAYWSFGLNSRFNDFTEEVSYDLVTSNFDVPNSPRVNVINFEVTDFTNQAYVRTVLREEFLFALGVEHKFLKYGSTTFGQSGTSGDNERILFEKSHYYSSYGNLILDTYNDKYFPSKGLYFNGDFHWYLLSSDFNGNFKPFSVAKAEIGGAFPVVGGLSLNLVTEGGFKLGKNSRVTSFDFVLGGYGARMINNITPFVGYDFLSLVGNSYVKAYGRADYEVAPRHHLMFMANFANVGDDLFRVGEWFTPPDYSGYGLGYGWESFLGPVEVFYTWTPEGKQGGFFFSVGYWF